MNSEKSIKELIEDFLNDTDIQENTKDRYRMSLSLFIDWAVKNGVDVRHIQKKDLVKYKNKYLRGKDLSSLTVDSYLGAIKSFFKYLKDCGIYDVDITNGIHSPKKYKGYRKGHLSVENIRELFSSIDRQTVKGKRDYAIINLIAQNGLRCCEVSGMNITDITYDEGNHFIKVKRKRSWDKETIGITNNSYHVIWEYLETREEYTNNSPAFVTISPNPNERLTPERIGRIIESYLIRTNLKSKTISAHSLRHSAAINALNAGATIYEVQQMLGHASIETTSIYLSSQQDQVRLNNRAINLLDELYN